MARLCVKHDICELCMTCVALCPYKALFVDEGAGPTEGTMVITTTPPEHHEFPKIPRLSREIVITEKIDGTNGLIHVTDYGDIFVGSKSRWLTLENDNHGFFKWVMENVGLLMDLGPGYHYGEWWGQGIQRGYGLKEKRFSLFNLKRWGESRPECCEVVPVLYRGEFTTDAIEQTMKTLAYSGSIAAPGFMKPEGVVIYHTAANALFKKTFENDDGKEQQKRKRGKRDGV